jgi:AbrB family looped-hinge helix DNA binding protein
MKTKITEDGGVVIPSTYLKALRLRPGDEVSIFLEGGEIKIASTRQVVLRAQDIVRRYVARGKLLSDELI